MTRVQCSEVGGEGRSGGGMGQGTYRMSVWLEGRGRVCMCVRGGGWSYVGHFSDLSPFARI